MGSSRKTLFYILFVGFSFFFQGCAHYRYPSRALIDETASENKTAALKHPLYHIVPRHRSQICWIDLPHWTTWALFGNDDDGIFGEEPSADYLPDERICATKALRWFLRNPLHNFTFYVIGGADRCNGEFDILRIDDTGISSGHYRCPARYTFPSKKSSCFYVALHGGKPFVALRWIHCPHHQSDFYLGWRCRGNFGAKCVIWGHR